MLRLLVFDGEKRKQRSRCNAMAHGSNPCIEFKASLGLERNTVSKTKQYKNSNKQGHYSRAWLPNLVTQMSSLALKTACLALWCERPWQRKPCQGVWKECKHMLPARPQDRGQACAGSLRTLLLSDLQSYHRVTPRHKGGGYKLISVWGFLNGGDPQSSVDILSSCRQIGRLFSHGALQRYFLHAPPCLVT